MCVAVLQRMRRLLVMLCQLRPVRSFTTSLSNTFIKDKSYVNGKWVAAAGGKTFDGELLV